MSQRLIMQVYSFDLQRSRAMAGSWIVPVAQSTGSRVEMPCIGHGCWLNLLGSLFWEVQNGRKEGVKL